VDLTWDLLQPGLTAGFGSKVKAITSDSVPSDTVVEIRQARSYLTRVDDAVVALSWVCPHLGCRAPFCDSSGCHGSKFNRAGDYMEGPSPRGMDRFAVEIVDGMVIIDTSSTVAGLDPGKTTIDEPARGPHCTSEGT